jgi:glycosyltransferase involved in cell wall biosynthesis
MAGLVSVIVPALNEEGNIEPLFKRLTALAQRIRDEFGMMTEVVVNDNCSTDRTLDELREQACRIDPELIAIRIFRFSRNIGFQKSILVGYRKSRGDAVAQIDADMQDPPELLLEFLRRWREGYQVVYGVRRRPEEALAMRAARKTFYRLINRLSEDVLPHDAGDFRLLDRQVVDVVCALHDNDPYLRGTIASLGLRQLGIAYDRSSRTRGQSKFGLTQLAKLAIDGITNHTTIPLRLASYLALGLVFAAGVLVCFYLFAWLTSDQPMPLGFMTLALLQLGTMATTSFLFAIQGFYLQRMYNQLKDKPLAIIEHSISQKPQGDVTTTKRPIEVLWAGDHGEQRSESVQ